MTSITPPCHVERSRDISAALAAWREPKYLLRRFYEISPRALLGRDDKRGREGRGVREKKMKKQQKSEGIFRFSRRSVGITGLEPATSRPPDVCATNCAKSRFAAAKVRSFFETTKFLAHFFCFYPLE